jgi:transposase
VVTMIVYKEIKAFKLQGLSHTAIARRLGLTRKTVRKYCRMGEQEYTAYLSRLSRRGKRFTPYREEIVTMIKGGEDHTVYIASIYDVLEERHGRLPGTLRTLTNYIAALRAEGQLDGTPRRFTSAVAPQPPGKQMQMDFGEYRLRSGKRAYIYAAILSHSRARYVVVQDHPFRTEEVILHTIDAFQFYGGRPLEVVIDQDRLMVVSENGGDIIYTEQFGQLLSEQELQMWVCRKGDPQSKGKIENAVKFVKSSFFSARSFSEVAQIHEPLRRWLHRRANGQPCQATLHIPAEVLDGEERAALRPLRASIFERERRVLRDRRKACPKGLISVGANRYSVPLAYRGKPVDIFLAANQLFIFDAHSALQIAQHELSALSGQLIVKQEHKAPAGASREELFSALEKTFALIEWKRFLVANCERYPRYWREQYAGLSALAGQVNDTEVFSEALQLCLECSTLTASNLADTYRHLLEHRHHAVDQQYVTALGKATGSRGPVKRPKISVQGRSLDYYSAAVVRQAQEVSHE